MKLGHVKLIFDSHTRNMVSRTQVFAKLAAAEGMTVAQALKLAGLAEDIEALVPHRAHGPGG